MKNHPKINISITGGGSGNGIKALIEGMIDIANSSRFIKGKEIIRAANNGIYPVPFLVGYDCILPIVHPSNTIRSLSIMQLKMIYLGQIRNWRELNGPDKKIVIISRDSTSGTYEVWKEMVMDNEKISPISMSMASNGAVIHAVSRNERAIGYIGLAYLNDSVKALRIQDVMGSAKAAKEGTYPITRPLYMFTQNWPEKETALFLKFIQHPDKGQKIIEDHGFIPMY